MKRWMEIRRSVAPGGGTVSLHRRGAEFVILTGRHVLLSSGPHALEERFAELGCAELGPAPHVLLGGLGMGFTLRAVLDVLPVGGRVLVVEIIPAFIDWNWTLLGALAGHPLEDRRVELRAGDVADEIRHGMFDAILLDVDESPLGLSRAENEALYREPGLAFARRALRPGGRLVIGSAVRAPELERRMEGAGFDVAVYEVRIGRSGGPLQAIHVGVAP